MEMTHVWNNETENVCVSVSVCLRDGVRACMLARRAQTSCCEPN